MTFSRTFLSTRVRVRALTLGLPALLAPFSWTSPASAQETEPAEVETLTLLVGGLDTRTPDQPENTDVFLIARVDVPNRTVRAVNVPRDLYVTIPGYGADKITRAYDYGSKAADSAWEAGADLMVQTVAANFGVEADGVVLTTFEGFIEIVDALGGVDVVNPYDVYDAEYPTFDYGIKEIYYPAGELHLDGEQALEFARTRHQDGDEGRVIRQQLVLRAMLERARDPKVAQRLPKLLEKTRDGVRTDLSPAEQLALTLAAPRFSNDDVIFATLTPYLYSDYAPNGAWIYAGDWSQLPGLVQGFLSGTVEL